MHGEIPRVVHQIWFGSEVPARFDEWRRGWTELHGKGGWEYRLWTDADMASFPLSQGPVGEHIAALLANASSHVERSDILRLDILFAKGGLYVDTDFERVAGFDAIHERCFLYAGVSNTGCVELNNGLLGAAAGHPWLGKLVMAMALSVTPVPSANMIIARTGPGFFTRSFMRLLLAPHTHTCLCMMDTHTYT